MPDVASRKSSAIQTPCSGEHGITCSLNARLDSQDASCCLASYSSGRSLESIVPPDTGEDTLHLLKQMLQMNTMLRLTAAQALEHPFLNDCPVLQTTSSTKDGSVDKPLTEVFDKSAVDFR